VLDDKKDTRDEKYINREKKKKPVLNVHYAGIQLVPPVRALIKTIPLETWTNGDALACLEPL
jgi:hypothetical protein